jgi:hypothetical protein
MTDALDGYPAPTLTTAPSADRDCVRTSEEGTDCDGPVFGPGGCIACSCGNCSSTDANAGVEPERGVDR